MPQALPAYKVKQAQPAQQVLSETQVPQVLPAYKVKQVLSEIQALPAYKVIQVLSEIQALQAPSAPSAVQTVKCSITAQGLPRALRI